MVVGAVLGPEVFGLVPHPEQFHFIAEFVDYEVTLAADGALTGKLLRNGSDSPIKGARQLADKAQPGRDP